MNTQHLETDKNWRIDKSIPIIPAIFLIAQTMAFIIWGTAFVKDTDNRLQALEKSEQLAYPNGNRLTILEQNNIAIMRSLDRIEQNQNRSLQRLLKEVAPEVQGKL